MHFLIRFAQMHEQFRQAEIEALGTIAGVPVEVISYSNKVRVTPLPRAAHYLRSLKYDSAQPPVPNDLFSHHFA
jgi:tRNA G10  N-methylase Trm11